VKGQVVRVVPESEMVSALIEEAEAIAPIQNKVGAFLADYLGNLTYALTGRNFLSGPSASVVT
jgi:hypothetical protein